MINTFLAGFGLLLIASPFYIIWRDGYSIDRPEEWMADQPLHKIFTIQGMIVSGFLFLGLGAAF